MWYKWLIPCFRLGRRKPTKEAANLTTNEQGSIPEPVTVTPLDLATSHSFVDATSINSVDSRSQSIEIEDIGFSEVAAGGERPLLDIVIIHGLGGHPRRTWYDRSTARFWPRDFLAKSFPRARILVYGYDSKISKFTARPASQNSFLDHARNLLLDTRGVRRKDPTRPLLFICHSLGGILVKDVLRRCKPKPESNGQEPGLQENIFKSTVGIIFRGTPHQGGNYRSLSIAAERIVRCVGFDTNNSILHDLANHGTALELIQEEFLGILGTRSPLLPIYSFQEEYALTGVSGFKDKVVDDSSSKIGWAYETVATLPGNHKEISRLGKAYNRLEIAVDSYLKNIEDPDRAISSIPRIPYERDPDFLGRQKELEKLHDFFLTEKFFECAVVGLGGVGKTQVAIEFTYRLCEMERYLVAHMKHSIVWLHASSNHRLEQGLKRLATSLGFVKAKVLPALRDWFSGEESGRWLLIIDNADDEAVFFGDEYWSNFRTKQSFSDFLPSKGGCGILYTSRNESLVRNLIKRSSPANLITINPMSTKEAVELVEQRLKETVGHENLRSTRGITEELVEALERLPLALISAAELMRVNHDTIRDPKAYLELWNRTKQDRQDLLQEHFVDWRRRDLKLENAVFRSWALSFEQLARQNEDSIRLLSLMSTLDRQGIPEWLLEFYSPLSQSAVRRKTCLGLLRSFSFISSYQDGKDQKWQMHRLVQMATHAYISQSDMEQALREGLRMLAEAFLLHIYPGKTRQFRYEKSLEYYPHAKSLTDLLQVLGGPVGGHTSGSKSASIVSQTLDDFARHFKTISGRQRSNWAEVSENLHSAFKMISNGNADSLEDAVMFVRTMQRGSAGRFSYDGKLPQVSDPIYGNNITQNENLEKTDTDQFDYEWLGSAFWGGE